MSFQSIQVTFELYVSEDHVLVLLENAYSSVDAHMFHLAAGVADDHSAIIQ